MNKMRLKISTLIDELLVDGFDQFGTQSQTQKFFLEECMDKISEENLKSLENLVEEIMGMMSTLLDWLTHNFYSKK